MPEWNAKRGIPSEKHQRFLARHLNLRLPRSPLDCLVTDSAAIQRGRLVAVLFGFYWGLNGLAEKARFLAEVHGRFRTTT